MKKIAFGALLFVANFSTAQCPFDPLINEPATVICPGTTTTLSTQTYDSYQWYKSTSSSGVGAPIPGETGQTLVVNDFGYYTVEATVGGCSEFSNTILVDVYAFLSPGIISSGQSTFCDGDSTLIEITFGSWTNIQWSKDFVPIPGASNNSFWVTESGTYTVSASPSSCPGTTMSSGVGPTFTFNTPVTPTLNWDLIELTSSSAVTYQWNLNGSPITGATSQTYTPAVSGNYSVTTIDNNGCEAISDTVYVDICTYTPSIIQSDTTICPGDTFTLSTLNYDNYQWYSTLVPGSVGNPVFGEVGQTLDVTSPGYYTVLTTLNGCTTYSNTVMVNVHSFPAPVITTSDPIEFCQGDSALIEVVPATWNSVEWYLDGALISGANGSSYVAGTGGNYTVVTSPVACPDMDLNGTTSIDLIVNIPSVPVVSWDGSSLSSTPASSYQWNLNGGTISGAINQTYVPVSNGTYTVTTTDINGCEATSDTTEIILIVDGIQEDFAEQIRVIGHAGFFEIICEETVEQVEIRNIEGKLVPSQLRDSRFVDYNYFSSGVCIVTIMTNSGTYSRKFFVR